MTDIKLKEEILKKIRIKKCLRKDQIYAIFKDIDHYIINESLNYLITEKKIKRYFEKNIEFYYFPGNKEEARRQIRIYKFYVLDTIKKYGEIESALISSKLNKEYYIDIDSKSVYLFIKDLKNEGIIERILTIKNLREKHDNQNSLKQKKRNWLFWMDTRIEEITPLLEKIDEMEKILLMGNKKKEIMNAFWNEILCKRFSRTKRPSSFHTNYILFLNTLKIWNENGELTDLGREMLKISREFGEFSHEFKNSLHYFILTVGGYLKMLMLIDRIQKTDIFDYRGAEGQQIKDIRTIRKRLNLGKNEDKYDKELVLPLYKEENGKCWLKVLGMKFIELGYGTSLTTIIVELNRRFGPTFQKSMQTGFYIEKYKKEKGYTINWKRIDEIMLLGEKSLYKFL